MVHSSIVRMILSTVVNSSYELICTLGDEIPRVHRMVKYACEFSSHE